MRSKDLQNFYNKLAERSKELEEFYKHFKPEYDYHDEDKLDPIYPRATRLEPQVDEATNSIRTYDIRTQKNHLTRSQLLEKPYEFFADSPDASYINSNWFKESIDLRKEYFADLQFPLSVTRAILLPEEVLEDPSKLQKKFNGHVGTFWVPSVIVEARDPKREHSSYYSGGAPGYLFLNLIATIPDENSVDWLGSCEELEEEPADIMGILIYSGSHLTLNEIRIYDENSNFIESESVNFDIIA